MVLNLQRVPLPAIGEDFRLRLDLSQLSPQGGDVHPDQFAARVFLAPDAPGEENAVIRCPRPRMSSSMI